MYVLLQVHFDICPFFLLRGVRTLYHYISIESVLAFEVRLVNRRQGKSVLLYAASLYCCEFCNRDIQLLLMAVEAYASISPTQVVEVI